MIARPTLATTLALASLVALAGHAMLGAHGPMLPRTVPVLAAVVIAAISVRAGRSRDIATLCAALSCAMLLPIPWQAAMALALVGWMLLRRRVVRPQRGRIPILATMVVGGVTPLALAGWVIVLRPDLSDVVRANVPDLPLSALVAVGIAFALINATLEELIWRGVIQQELAAITTPAIAIAVQAISFGIQHAHGVPRGLVGVLLAGTWAVMLGMLRRHAGGLLAPIAAHVVADASIAVIVFSLAQT